MLCTASEGLIFAGEELAERTGKAGATGRGAAAGLRLKFCAGAAGMGDSILGGGAIRVAGEPRCAWRGVSGATAGLKIHSRICWRASSGKPDEQNSGLHFRFAGPRDFAARLDPVGGLRQLEPNMWVDGAAQNAGAMHGKAAFAHVQDDAAVIVAEIDIGERFHVAPRKEATVLIERKIAPGYAISFTRIT